MSFKGSTLAVNDSSSLSQAITPSGYSIAAGDYLILPVMQKVSGNVTFTKPSSSGSNSWVDAGTLTSAVPYRQTPGGNPTQVFVKIADSTDVGTPTYTVSSNYSEPWVVQLIVATGRLATSNINTAFPNNVVTANGSSANTPYAYSYGSITPNAGDDIVAGFFADISGGLLSSPSISATGFSDAVAGGNSTSSPALLASMFEGNVAAGATGAIASTISNGATLTMEGGGFMMALPAGTAHKPKGQFFFGDVLKAAPQVAMLMPLAWVIERRNALRGRR